MAKAADQRGLKRTVQGLRDRKATFGIAEDQQRH